MSGVSRHVVETVTWTRRRGWCNGRVQGVHELPRHLSEYVASRLNIIPLPRITALLQNLYATPHSTLYKYFCNNLDCPFIFSLFFLVRLPIKTIQLLGIVRMDRPIVLALGILGNAVSFMVFLAPLPTFFRVYRKKSTEGFQAIPYIVALFSAMFWLYYGAIKPDCTLIVTINSAGCIIETFYISIYLAFAPKQAKIMVAKLLMFMNVGVFGSVVLFTLLLSEGKKRIVIVGWMSSAISVTVFAAPLSILRLVICTKSAEFMPFYLSFFLTVSATIWFAYGLLIKDMFLALPNVLGFLFGIVQMVVYFIYRNPEKLKDEKVTDLSAINAAVNSVSLAEIHPINIPPCEQNEGGNSGNTAQMSDLEGERSRSELR